MVLPASTTYTLSSTLNIGNPDVTIKGAGFSTVIQRGATQTTPVINLTGVNDEITDLTVDGNATVNSGVTSGADLQLVGQNDLADHINSINIAHIGVSLQATDTRLTASFITGLSSTTLPSQYGVWAIGVLIPAQAAHLFRDDAAHLFRLIVAQRSDLSSPTIPG